MQIVEVNLFFGFHLNRLYLSSQAGTAINFLGVFLWPIVEL